MMDQIITEISKFLASQGWAGVLVVLAGAVIWDQRKDIHDLRVRNNTLQDLRVQDAKDITEKALISIETTRSAVQGFTEVLKDRRA